MNRRTVISAIAVCLLLAYVFTVVPLTTRAERNDTFAGLTIKVEDRQNTGFVREAEIRRMLNVMTGDIDTLRRRNLNTMRVERMLNSNNRIENSSCMVLNNGVLLVTVDPIDPVARVFDSKGSVYVNAEGKRVPAAPSYHIDVPVVMTNAVADSNVVRKLLPLLRAVKADEQANALVSSLRVDDRGDIIIIPNVVGHVINFGDTTLIANKFDRLRTFYRKVMPVRGWDAFDTISVKWDGRVVATKRNKNIPGRINLNNLEDIVDEVPDDATMMVN